MAKKSVPDTRRARREPAPSSSRDSSTAGPEIEAAPAPGLRPTVGNQAMQRLLGSDDLDGALSPGVIQEVQRTLGNQAVQRLLNAAIQRSPTGAWPTEDLGQSIRAEAGHGQPLDSGVRQSLESGLGADLSSVRVHTDHRADHLSRAVNAVAFTSGSDIFFRSGTYNPGSPSGMHLLAHEVTHVVQQASGPVAATPVPGGISLSDPGDRFEQAAEQTATQMAQRLRANDASTEAASPSEDTNKDSLSSEGSA